MKKLTPIKEILKERTYPEDIERMSILLHKEGYVVSDNEIEEIWTNYSNDVCAGWIVLPKSDLDLLELILDYSTLTEYEEFEINREGISIDVDLLKDSIDNLTDKQIFQLKILLVDFNLT